MKLLASFALFAAALAAQTASYPSALPTDADLLVQFDRASTRLSAGIDASTLTIPVQNGGVFPLQAGAATIVTIEDEQIQICSRSGNTLTACAGGRGFAGTTAASHASTRDVRGLNGAWYHNRLRAEVKALAEHTADNRTFDFQLTPQTYTGDLTTAGAKTITIASPHTCPRGFDVGNYGRVSGGIGAGETIRRTGGSCTGGGTGTLEFTTVNTHSGATVSSATAGIQEASNWLVATTNGGDVKIAAGTFTLYARIESGSGVKLRGAGRTATRLKVAPHSFGLGAPVWVNVGNPNIVVVVSTALFASNWGWSGFTVDGDGTNQTVTRPYAFPVSAMAGTNGFMDDIGVENFYATGAGIGLIGPQSSNIVVSNSWVTGDVTKPAAGCIGGFFSQGPDNVFENNYTKSLCDDGFIASGYRSKRNKFIGNTSIAHAGNVGFHCESGYDCHVEGNTAAGLWGACFGATDIINEGIGNAIFVNNVCKTHVQDFPDPNPGQGTPQNGFVGGGAVNLAALQASPTISDSTVTIANNIVEGCIGRGVSTGGLASRLIITGNHIKGCVIGLAFESASTTLVPKAVSIRGNVLDHNVVGMRFSNTTPGGKPIDYFIVDGNIVTDTFTPKTQNYGMEFTSSGVTFDNAIITNNILSGNITAAVNGLNMNDFRGVWSGNITSGTDAALSALIRSPGRYFQLGVPNAANNPEFQFFTSGNAGIVDSALSASGGSAVPHSGNIEMKVNALYMGGNLGYFVPRAVNFADLPSPIIPNAVIVCQDCSAGPVCSAGGGKRLAIADGTYWTCNP